MPRRLAGNEGRRAAGSASLDKLRSVACVKKRLSTSAVPHAQAHDPKTTVSQHFDEETRCFHSPSCALKASRHSSRRSLSSDLRGQSQGRTTGNKSSLSHCISRLVGRELIALDLLPECNRPEERVRPLEVVVDKNNVSAVRLGRVGELGVRSSQASGN